MLFSSTVKICTTFRTRFKIRFANCLNCAWHHLFFHKRTNSFALLSFNFKNIIINVAPLPIQSSCINIWRCMCIIKFVGRKFSNISFFEVLRWNFLFPENIFPLNFTHHFLFRIINLIWKYFWPYENP